MILAENRERAIGIRLTGWLTAGERSVFPEQTLPFIGRVKGQDALGRLDDR